MPERSDPEVLDFDDWRDPQGFTRAQRLEQEAARRVQTRIAQSERAKEERIRRLRARFAVITDLYERAVKRRDNGLLFPALVGLAAGSALYFLIWEL